MLFPTSDHQPPTDLHTRRLQQQLDAARALSNAAWEDGYRTGRRDRELDIPTELDAALRYGSAQDHIQVPIDDDQFTVILAHDGNSQLDDHTAARAWETLQRVYRELTESHPATETLLHLELPEPIAAVVWRNGEHVAVAVSRTASRAHLKAVLRSRYVPRGAGVVLALVGAAAGRRLVRGAAPVVAATAVTVAAVTAVAMPHITGPDHRPSVSAPAQPGPLADDGDDAPQKSAPTPAPSRPPLAAPSPGASVPPSHDVPPVLDVPTPADSPSSAPGRPPVKVRTHKPGKHPGGDGHGSKPGKPGDSGSPVDLSPPSTEGRACLLPRVLKLIGLCQRK